MQIRRVSTWKQLTLFGLAGPPIGALTLLLWGRFAWEAPLPFDPRAWLVVAFPAAYLYAGVPALVSGYSAALTHRLASGSAMGARILRFTVPVLVGSVASVLFSLVTIASEPSASFAAAGAFAAFTCTALIEWWARLRPNNSSKPTPLRGAA